MQRVLHGMTSFFTNLMRLYLPDPFVFAIGLTLLTLILSIVLQGSNVVDVISMWGGKFWSLLSFTTQMATVLVAGYVLANTPAIDRCTTWLVKYIRTPHSAIIAATLIGGVGSYLNWGFGLIVGALVAKKFAQNIKGLHYPLIMASAYSGFVFYGSGFTGTIPVLIATKGHFLEPAMGVIPLGETIFAIPILVMNGILLISLPLLNSWMHPKDKGDIIEIPPIPEESIAVPGSASLESDSYTFAEKMNNNRLVVYFLVMIGMIYLFFYFQKGGSADLNIINFIMIFLGLLLMGNPRKYVSTLSDGAKSVAGILLQYPFYAGIMAIMDGSGLVNTMADWFVRISTAETLPLWGLVSSFFINFFAPSAGGHWVIQGPFMIEAAQALQADMGKTAMAVMLGNAWNDLVQPFWLLPTLAISGLKLSDIMGYTVVCMLWTAIVFCGGVLAWGYL